MSRLPGILGDLCQRLSEVSPIQESKVILWIKPTLTTLSKPRESFSSSTDPWIWIQILCAHMCACVWASVCFSGKKVHNFSSKISLTLNSPEPLLHFLAGHNLQGVCTPLHNSSVVRVSNLGSQRVTALKSLGHCQGYCGHIYLFALSQNPICES